MTRQEAGDMLQAGAQLDGCVLSAEGHVLCRGKIVWEGTQLIACRDGDAAHLQLLHKGEKLTVPLVHTVPLRMGQPLDIKFGPNWPGRRK